MKVFLPFIIIAAVLLVVISPGAQKFTGSSEVASAEASPTPAAGAAGSGGMAVGEAAPPDDTWVKDADVTFVGKTAARSGLFLDWSLSNYNWVSLNNNDTNPLVSFWKVIRDIVYAFFSIFVLITAFVIMITRGKNITVMRFIPRFIGIILLVTFSFALIQFLYQIFDIIQGFFLRNPDDPTGQTFISQANLLNIGFNYAEFIGYRKVGVANDEAAVITLLLTKLTAITYYVMVGVLIVRKIILWFFIIISPIFPLLILYRPVRNTGKIWLGEFFRWLLYAPLFSVLLSGLVSLWRAGIPLFKYDAVTGNVISKYGEVGKITDYPTAVNILLGGPKQTIAIGNSVNLPETFALYVVCLIMLWVTIILPFVLLRIFLDYVFSLSLSENNSVKQVLSLANSFVNKPPALPPVGPQAPPPAGAGLARALPFTKRFSIPTGVARTVTENAVRANTVETNTNTNTSTSATSSRSSQSFNNVSTVHSERASSEITKLTNLTVPTMRDIAKYETSQLSSHSNQRSEVTQVNQSLQKIANPTQTATPVEREKYVEVREKLVTESQKGNVLATTILNAANTVAHTNISNHTVQNSAAVKTVFKQLANPERITNTAEREQYKQVKDKIVSENQSGNQVAASLLAYINNLSENTTIATQNISVENMQKFLKNVSTPISISDSTTKNTYMQLHDQLISQSKAGNTLATTILSISSGTPASPEQLTQLKEQLTVAQKSGDPVATAVLSNIQKESGELDVTQVREKLVQAKAKGDKVATVLLSLVDAKQQTSKTATTPGALPVVNRLQTVSFDDYEAVKKTWRESYKNVDVPQKIDRVQTRKEWIQSDITDISATISLLSSPDAEKRAEGMKAVSGILPFLLIGGFSQTEIVAYLKAKLEAAKDVSTEINDKDQEEGSLVDTQKKSYEAPKSMHMTTEAAIPASSISSPDTSDDESPSPLQTIIKSAVPVQAPVTETIATQHLITTSPVIQLTNISIPSMKDIATFETNRLEHKSVPEVATLTDKLAKIAQPTIVTEPAEQQKFQGMRERLVTESNNGDSLASSILTAATTLMPQPTQLETPSEHDVHSILEKLTHVDTIPSPQEKEQVVAVREQIMKEKNNGDALATEVATIIEHPTSGTPLTPFIEKLVAAKQTQNGTATALLSLLPPAQPAKQPQIVLPDSNRVQSVSVEDYEAVKKIWLDSYKTVSYPQQDGKISDRKDWIQQDMSSITETIALLTAADPEKKQQGMKNVSEILPFLLIGGFSQTEVITYLKAKLEAGKEVSSELDRKEQEEGTLLDIPSAASQPISQPTGNSAQVVPVAAISPTPVPSPLVPSTNETNT